MTKAQEKPALQGIELKGQTRDAVAASLGAHIKAVRLQKNISQKELAKSAGVARSSLQTLEAGGGMVTTLIAVLMELNALEEVLGTLEKDISRKVKNKVHRGGRASSRGGFSK